MARSRPIAALPILWLILLPGVVLFEALSPDVVLAPGDVVLSMPPWRGEVVPRDYVSERAILSDHVKEFLPWARYARDRVRDGELPLWNPKSGAGRPFLANPQAGVLAPTAGLRYVLPIPLALVATAWLQLALAGLGMFLWMRSRGADRAPATVAGVAFQLSSFLVLWLGHPHVRVAIWLPWSLLALHAVWRRPTPGRIVGLTTVLAVQFLGGHPETSFHMCVFVGLAFVVEVIVGRRIVESVGKSVAAIAGATVVAVLVCGVQLVPFLEYLDISYVLHLRDGNTAEDIGAAPWRHLLTTIVPDVFGQRDIPPRPPAINYCEGTYYVGLVTLWLALSAVGFAGRHRRPAIIALGFATTVFAVVFGMPGVASVVESLPGFGIANNIRLFLLGEFFLAIAAGWGMQAWARAERPFPVKIAIGGLAAVATILGLLAFDVHDRGIGLLRLGDGADVGQVVSGIVRAAVLAGFIVVVFALRMRRKVTAKSFAVAVVLLVSVDLSLFARGFNPIVDRDDFFPSHPIIEQIREGESGRLLGIHPEVPLWYGLDDIAGFDAIEPMWMAEMLERGGLHEPILAPSTLLDLLSVRYVVGRIFFQSSAFATIAPGRTHEVRSDRDNGGPLRTLRVATTMLGANAVPDDTVVGVLEVVDHAGEVATFPISAGAQTAAAKANQGGPRRHAVPSDAMSWPFPGPDGVVDFTVCSMTCVLPEGRRWVSMKLTSRLERGFLVLACVQSDPVSWNRSAPGFVPLRIGRGGVLHENPTALPRAFIVDRALGVSTEEAKSRTLAGRFDPAEIVFVEGKVAGVEGQDDTSTQAKTERSRSRAEKSATIVVDDPERVVIRTTSARSAWLVLADTWFPGWEASVDDRDVDILRANGCVRAVRIPAGESEVVFVYRPASVRWGGVASMVGLVLIVGLLGVAATKRWRFLCRRH